MSYCRDENKKRMLQMKNVLFVDLITMLYKI